MDLGVSGLASGFDWRSLVDQLIDVERAPEKRLQSDQAVLGQQNDAFSSVVAQLNSLKSGVDALKDPSLFDTRSASVSDSTVATASAAGGAAIGSYAFNIKQLATAALQQGTGNVGQALSGSNDVSGLVLSAAAFSTAVTAGTFMVNGKQVTIATSDTLKQVFDKIDTATGGTVTASYDSGTDKITLSSASEIVLGSATDTSNFLQAAKLLNNGTGTISSSAALGVVKLSGALSNANLAVAVSDGGSGAGVFKINGVSISFDASRDSAADVLARINNSNAGVTASYDAANDRFVLSSKTTGDIGIALEDVTGNFLAATGLSSGTLVHGQNLIYTINGGTDLTSQSNTITEASSNITGLTVTALSKGTTTVQVNTDTAHIKSAITDFIAAYNKVQSLIDRQTASTTDADGKVTAGVLAGDSDANDLAGRLRGMVNASIASLNATVKRLDSLGIQSNGSDDSLELADSDQLDAALTSNLDDVKQLFSNSSDGLMVKLSDYLDRTVGENGSLITRQADLTKQSSDIDQQIADMERIIQNNRQTMIDSFVAMEQTQSQINQQLQFLNQRFGSG